MLKWFRRKKEEPVPVDHGYSEDECFECDNDECDEDCSHKWQEYERFNLIRDRVIYGFVIILQCEHCGDLKNHRLLP